MSKQQFIAERLESASENLRLALVEVTMAEVTTKEMLPASMKNAAAQHLHNLRCNLQLTMWVLSCETECWEEAASDAEHAEKGSTR